MMRTLTRRFPHTRLLVALLIASAVAGAPPLPGTESAPPASATPPPPAHPLTLEDLQNADGSWDDGMGVPDAGHPNAALCTALGACLFLSMGYDHKTPARHRAGVAKALGWIRAHQHPDGLCDGPLPACAIQTLDLLEAQIMTGDQDLEAPCGRALHALLALRTAQSSHSAVLAWRDADGSIATRDNLLCVLALKSGIADGKDEAAPGLADARAWLLATWDAAGAAAHATGAAPAFPATIDASASPPRLIGSDPTDALLIAAYVGIRPPMDLYAQLERRMLAEPRALTGRLDYFHIWVSAVGLLAGHETAAHQAWLDEGMHAVRGARQGSGRLAYYFPAGTPTLDPAMGQMASSLLALNALATYARIMAPPPAATAHGAPAAPGAPAGRSATAAATASDF